MDDKDGVDDRLAVVIDNGSHKCKAGFAGDDAPRSVFYSLFGRPNCKPTIPMPSIAFKDIYVGDEAQYHRSVLSLSYPITEGLITNWDDAEKLWHHIFYKELTICPEECDVLFTEVPFTPKRDREKLAEVMFEVFNVQGMNSKVQSELALLGTGLTDGVEVSLGDGACWIVPIYDGHYLPSSTLKFNVSGLRLTDYLYELLSKRYYPFHMLADKEDVRRMKETMCYTAQDFKEELKSVSLEKSYTLPNGKREIVVDRERIECPEASFQPTRIGIDTPGLHQVICDAIMKCDIELRQNFFSNIVLSGGTSMMSGLVDRLRDELEKICPQTFKKKIIAPPERKLVTWIGGSIVGSSMIPSMSSSSGIYIKKTEYDESGPSIINRKII